METIHQYVRDNKGRKVGILVGRLSKITHETGKIKIGWSRVNRNAGDKFDREFGMELALKRTAARQMVKCPQSMEYDVFRFAKRCKRYFKSGVLNMGLRD